MCSLSSLLMNASIWWCAIPISDLIWWTGGGIVTPGKRVNSETRRQSVPCSNHQRRLSTLVNALKRIKRKVINKKQCSGKCIAMVHHCVKSSLACKANSINGRPSPTTSVWSPPSHLWCDWRIDWILASHIQERHYRPHTYCAASPLCVVRITAAVESSCRVAGSYKRVVSRAEVSSLQGPHRSKPPKALRVQGRFCCSTIMARLASCALGGFPSSSPSLNSSPSPSSSDLTDTQCAATNFFRFGAQLSIYSVFYVKNRTRPYFCMNCHALTNFSWLFKI